jgi:hypothetical protein
LERKSSDLLVTRSEKLIPKTLILSAAEQKQEIMVF